MPTKESDSIQRFSFVDANIRGQIVHLGYSFQTLLRQHQYPKALHKILGETLVASVLLAGMIKFKGELTIQFQNSGPLKLVVAKCNHEFHIKGLAQFSDESFDEDLIKSFKHGKLVVTITQQDKVKPYQSIIPIENQTVSECLQNYFLLSEQLPTKIWLAVDDDSVAGMFLQMLPGQATDERELFWEHAVKLGETIKDEELLHCDNKTILHRLYHQETLRLFEAHPISFRCQCSKERMLNAIKMLGKADAMDEVNQHQVITVCCDYCNKHYDFDSVDITALFH